MSHYGMMLLGKEMAGELSIRRERRACIENEDYVILKKPGNQGTGK
jgi:hypothetical protein